MIDVLWNGLGPIEGSLDTILKLKQMGKKVFYVTNNSTSSRVAFVKKCEKYGFPAEEEDIVCTAYVAAKYLKSLDFKGKVYLMGLEESLGKELIDAGISYIGPGSDPMQGITYEDFLNTELDPEVNCVLVGFDPYVSYRKMIKASSYLKNPDCLFLVTNEDSFFPTKGPICIPGTGCITTPIKIASNREPLVMGKPETNMFEILSKVHNLELSKTMMVGDSPRRKWEEDIKEALRKRKLCCVEECRKCRNMKDWRNIISGTITPYTERYDTDIMFANRCGMEYSFLVLTGVTTKSEVQSGKASAKFYAPSLGDFGKYL